jgi:hypothetical protein
VKRNLAGCWGTFLRVLRGSPRVGGPLIGSALCLWRGPAGRGEEWGLRMDCGTLLPAYRQREA